MKKSFKIDYIDILLIIAPFLMGLLSIWSSALFAVLCIGGIIYKVIKNQKLNLPMGKQTICLLIYLFSFLIVEFYAIDKGMNLLAFFKNLTILFFLILYVQFEDDENQKKRRLGLIPYAACANLLLSFLIMLIPDTQVFLNERLQGIFEYANSYGLYLLVAVVILANKEKLHWYDYIVFVLLAVGIILTNSRAIIIMTIIALIISTFINRKNLKSIIALIVAVLCIFAAIYSLSQIEKRVNAEMLGSSEMVSRLLYYSDAVNMIKDNPFGYGYEGWYYKQAEVKTGVYDTKYVHNSVLQVMLDVGVIPTVALVIMLLFVFFDKKQTALTRLIMILVLGHSIIDLDLEYLYFIILIILVANFKTQEFSDDSIIKKIALIIISLCAIPYMMIFVSDANFALKKYKNAIDIIPFHSEAIQSILYSVTNKEEQTKYAIEALKYNEIVSGAYEALSNDLQDEKKYVEALSMEEKRLSYNKYEMYYYMNYAKFLSEAFNYYMENNDTKTAKIFIDKILQIEERINRVIEETNPLCYKTIHVPELEIGDDLRALIDKARKISAII